MFRGTSIGVERTKIFTEGLTHLTVFDCLLLRFHLDVNEMFFKIIRENIEMKRISQVVLIWPRETSHYFLFPMYHIASQLFGYKRG